jgi:hypothetical protein
MECLECPSSSRGIEVKFFFTDGTAIGIYMELCHMMSMFLNGQ